MEIIDGLSKFAAMDGKSSVQTQEEETMMSMRHSENNSEREQDPKFICSLIYYCLLFTIVEFQLCMLRTTLCCMGRISMHSILTASSPV